MPKFLPSLLRRPLHSLRTVNHKPQPSTVLLRLPYPTLFNTISSQFNHPSFPPSPKDKTKMRKSPLPTSLQPASQSLPSRNAKEKTQKTKNPRVLDQLFTYPTYLPICKIIKLFNSNILIQTFLSFPILSYHYPIFFYSNFSNFSIFSSPFHFTYPKR